MIAHPTITAFIVEDEPLARVRLEDLIRQVSWLTLVGEATDGPRALAAIDRVRPDLVFIDVRLAQGSGIQVVSRLTHRPAVIFTTAYDKFAVTAFELGAIDYLLKPFGRERFTRAVERARAVAQCGPDHGVADRARAVLAERAIPRLFVHDAGRIVPVRVSSIERIEAADDFVIVCVGTRRFTLSVPLTDLEARLPAGAFLRVHRSHLVNLDHVIGCSRRQDSRFDIVLRSGARITASRQRSRAVRGLAR